MPDDPIVSTGPSINEFIPGLQINFLGLPLGVFPDELKAERLYINDYDRIPDLVLSPVSTPNIKYLCWYNYQAQKAPYNWRIAQVSTSLYTDLGSLSESIDGEIYDTTPADNVQYNATMMLWPYGVDSYNFDINKITEYPFVIKGTNWGF